MSRAFSLMERAPSYVIYAFHVPYCLYLSFRYGGVTLPTIANPGIEGSGLSDESKTDLFALLGPVGRAHTAQFVTVTTGPDAPQEAKRRMHETGLSYPIIAKPDIGRRGYGVKLVHSEKDLAEHLAKFPGGIRMLIQRYVEGPGEAGVFYVRMPSEEKGHIISLTIKHFPEVVGDGVSTLREIILRDPRAPVSAANYLRRNRAHLERVLAKGERYQLVSIGNHVRGAIFEDGTKYVTPALEAVFDTIIKEVPGFFIGRFDVRYTTLQELQQGKGFFVVEYNGAGGEPTHMWDPETTVLDTYRGLLSHWKYLYAIGAENRARGARPMSVREVGSRFFHELHLLETYPDDEVE